jgi:hypothetical protein
VETLRRKIMFVKEVHSEYKHNMDVIEGNNIAPGEEKEVVVEKKKIIVTCITLLL